MTERVSEHYFDLERNVVRQWRRSDRKVYSYTSALLRLNKTVRDETALTRDAITLVKGESPTEKLHANWQMHASIGEENRLNVTICNVECRIDAEYMSSILSTNLKVATRAVRHDPD